MKTAFFWIAAFGLSLTATEAHAEYLRLTTTVRTATRMVTSFPELVARLDGAGLLGGPPGPVSRDPQLGYGCGGEYGFVSVVSGQDYVDVSWYVYDTETCAQQHISEVTASVASYGGAPPVWVQEGGRVVQVSSYGAPEVVDDVVRLIRGDQR